MNDALRRRNGAEIAVCPTQFRLEDYVPYRLSLLSNTVSQGIAHRYQQDHDVSVTEWRVIVVLGRYPGSTASEVVERTAMDKVTISRARISVDYPASFMLIASMTVSFPVIKSLCNRSP